MRAPASSVSAATTEDAIAREREFILAWTGGDEEALASMTDGRTTRIWPGGGATSRSFRPGATTIRTMKRASSRCLPAAEPTAF